MRKTETRVFYMLQLEDGHGGDSVSVSGSRCVNRTFPGWMDAKAAFAWVDKKRGDLAGFGWTKCSPIRVSAVMTEERKFKL